MIKFVNFALSFLNENIHLSTIFQLYREISLKVALDTIKQTNTQTNRFLPFSNWNLEQWYTFCISFYYSIMMEVVRVLYRSSLLMEVVSVLYRSALLMEVVRVLYRKPYNGHNELQVWRVPSSTLFKTHILC